MPQKLWLQKIWLRFYPTALANQISEYILNLLTKGTHEYEKFIKPSELIQMMENNGLTIKELTGMSYNPLTKNYWLGKNVDVNYLIHAKKI